MPGYRFCNIVESDLIGSVDTCYAPEDHELVNDRENPESSASTLIGSAPKKRSHSVFDDCDDRFDLRATTIDF